MVWGCGTDWKQQGGALRGTPQGLRAEAERLDSHLQTPENQEGQCVVQTHTCVHTYACLLVCLSVHVSARGSGGGPGSALLSGTA